MTLLLATPRFVFTIFLTVGVAAIVGCGGDSDPITSANSKYEVADEDSSGTKSAQIPADTNIEPRPTQPGTSPTNPGLAPQRPSPTPPAGASGPASDSPEDLMAYVAQLRNREPNGNNQEEILADFRRTLDEITGICERVFAMQTTPALRRAAAEMLVQSLSQMSQLGNTTASQRLDAFVVTLNASEDEGLQNLGFQLGFSSKMEDLQAGKDVDPESVIDDLSHLVATEAKDGNLLRIGSTVAAILEQTGHSKQAIQSFRMLAEAFKGSDDERLRAESAGLTERAYLLESDITTMLSAVLEGKSEATAPFLAASQGLLQREDAGFVTLSFFQQFAPTLEIANPEIAGTIYAAIGAAFKENSNQDLATMAKQIATSYETRSSLVGKPFTVEGTGLDGQQLDWSAYKDKVVLVAFWATEIEASRLELANIRQNYDLYHESGFEVVGINLDNDIQSLRRFLALQELPWPSVLGSDPTTRRSPMAEKYGVVSLPFLVLVGQDGNVLASNLRGNELRENLAKLFPEVKAELPASEATPAAPADAQSDESKKAAANPTPETVTPPKAAPAPAKNEGARTLSKPPQRMAHSSATRHRVGGFVGQTDAGAASGRQLLAAIADDDNDEEEAETNEDPASDINPYSPPSGLSPRQLVDFIFSMQEKPLSIQRRPGFAAAIAEAADQVLATDAPDQLQIVAAEAKFEVLHQAASLGDEQADKQLDAFVQRMQDDTRARIAKQIQFFRLERKALNADQIPLAAVPALLDELESYFTDQKLQEKHLRIASATVHAINRIADAPSREAYFEKFGAQFAASKDKELARYGRKIGQAPATSVADLVGQPLELNGVTALGTSFEWAAYRGKVVVVDFWATWCGPCRRETPHLQALAKTSDKLAVVAVSLDRNLEAVEKYLDQNEIQWTNLVGEEATQIAGKYGIRAIPTMLVVDAKGNVVAVGHRVADIQSKVQQLLAG